VSKQEKRRQVTCCDYVSHKHSRIPMAMIQQAAARRLGVQRLRQLYLRPADTICFNSRGFSNASGEKPRKRRRHRFDLSGDDVPSFQDFQQQVKVRSLFRSFLRLTKPTGEASAELRQQVRREFRSSKDLVDRWDIKRAVSEGSKRYKELSTMLQTSYTKLDGPKSESTVAPTESPWPWSCNSTPSPPLPAPKRR